MSAETAEGLSPIGYQLSAIGYHPLADGGDFLPLAPSPLIAYRLSILPQRPQRPQRDYRLSAIGYRLSAIGYRLS
ncbi:hypothetical protein, partial [Chloroflexus sp.]|uniref:hypothetical protein n=1 Tax=Chloroflexus sp. TaxID=1904827 RepID=UPI002FDAF174